MQVVSRLFQLYQPIKAKLIKWRDNISQLSRRQKIYYAAALMIVLILFGITLYSFCKPKKIPVVLTVQAAIAETSVTIMPQVAGTIQHIAFMQGDNVEAQQLLFELDSRPFVQNLAQAKAALQSAEANLAQGSRDAARQQTLVRAENISRQAAEHTKTTELTQRAAVAVAKAQVLQAEIQLSYTKIYAPIAGKSGEVTVQVGDYVTANGVMSLARINQLDNVLINFYVPQEEISRIVQTQQQAPLQALIFNEHSGQQLGKGELVFIDNQVNKQTAMVLLKVKVRNIKAKLLPGMLVKVRLIVCVDEAAVVVPVQAVQRDQKGKFVYCIDEHNKVVVARVVVARQVDAEAVIAEGINAGAKVITVLPPNLAEGAQVKETTD